MIRTLSVSTRHSTRSRPMRLAFAALMLVAGSAYGQGGPYPSRPVSVVVPVAAGGAADALARAWAAYAGRALGGTIVVENKPGANGVIAAQTLMSAPHDGYTYLVTDGSMMSINPYLYKNLSYQPKRDFVPVSLIATSPLFLATNTRTGMRTLDDFIARVKAAPADMNYGSSGVGSTHHLTMEALNLALHAKLVHVPFRGSGQSVPALVGNQVDVVFAALPSLSGFAEQGQVRILATNAGKRSSLAPDIPAIAEVVPNFDFAVTVGALAASGTPDYAVRRMNEEIARAVKDPAVVKQFQTLGIEAAGGTPEQYARSIDAEAARYADAIRNSGLKAD